MYGYKAQMMADLEGSSPEAKKGVSRSPTREFAKSIVE